MEVIRAYSCERITNSDNKQTITSFESLKTPYTVEMESFELFQSIFHTTKNSKNVIL